jgi:hypothetical protein
MQTVRRTDAFRHCPNAHKKTSNLPSLFDTIHNRTSVCILTTDLQLIHFLCSLSLQRRLFIAMPYSTVCYPLFLYSLQQNKCWCLISFSMCLLYFILYDWCSTASSASFRTSWRIHTVCCIMHSMLDVQLYLRPQCVLHTEHIYHTSIITMANYVRHSVEEGPSSPAPFPWTYLDYIWHGISYNSPTTNFKLLSLFSRKVWLPPTEKTH